jgi:uncharacterized Zn finger protein
MAKGQACPNCGNQTFHEDGPLHECSECGAIGWLGAPGPPGGGSGRTCGHCGSRRLRELFRWEDGGSLLHCYNCSASVLA